MTKDLKRVQKELKIKDKDLAGAQAIVSVLKDSLTVKIPRDTSKTQQKVLNCDFHVTVRHNAQTVIDITSIGDNLTVKPYITDSIFVYYYNERQYLNPDKGFFRRVFTWDWDKKTVTYHQLKRTNKLFKTEDAIFIEIINKN